MKITQVLLFIILSFFFLLFGVLEANAQQLREMQPLEVHDFHCLQWLECVENSQSLKDKGWSFIFDETVDEFAQELTASMKGENVSFFAIYDKEGFLIRSDYKRKNVALPKCLLSYLTEGKYKEWRITGSEMEMKDFDPDLVKYKVVLENHTSTTSEVFDAEFINDLHVKHEGLAKYCLL